MIKKQRRFGKVYVYTVVSVLCACLWAVQAMAVWSTLKFGVTPYMSEKAMRKGFEPLLDYLGSETFQRFELVIVSDYNQLTQRMNTGEIDIGAFSPFAYLDGVNTADVKIFASHIAEGGKASYHGLIITRKDSKIKTLDDLKGKTFAFVDPKSASGFIYPRAILISKGINPSDFFGKTTFLGNHENVLKAVLDGTVDAGAIYENALQLAKDKGKSISQITVISKTEPIPYDAYAVRKDLPKETVSKIQQALIRLDRRTDKGKRVLDTLNRELKIDGFILGEDASYNVVREAAAFRREKVRVAMLPFKEMGTSWDDDLAPMVTELFQNALIQSEKFWVSGVQDVKNVCVQTDRIDKQELDETILKSMDRDLKVKIALAGNVIHLGKKINLSIKQIGVPNGSVKTAITKTGTDEELHQMIMDMVMDLGEDYPVTGYVIVSENDMVMVDFGSEDGIKEGMPLVVYQEDKLLKNPLTGEILGRQEEVLAEVQVMSVTPKVSTCRIMKGDPAKVAFGKRARTIKNNEMIMVPY